MTKRQAEDVLWHVENIASSRRQGVSLSDADAAWLGSPSDSFHDVLVSKQLAEPRVRLEAEPEPDGLDEFLDEFMESGRTKKGNEASTNTRCKWKLVAARLKDFFGEVRELASMTPEDAYRFLEYLSGEPLVIRRLKNRQRLDENSVRKNIGVCQTFFNNAKRRGKILANSFDHEVSEVMENRERDFDVKAEIADRIIEACPDSQWKLLVALWRYAGLRKTEPLHLTWGDILWDQGRMRVVCSKTARHRGKGIRYVPIRDVRQYLDAVYFDADDGNEEDHHTVRAVQFKSRQAAEEDHASRRRCPVAEAVQQYAGIM